MKFLEVAEFWSRVESASSRLTMTDIIAEALEKAEKKDVRPLVYLSQGKLGPDFLEEDLGLGEKLVIEAIAKASGNAKDEVQKQYKKIGDIGELAEKLSDGRKQQSLGKQELSFEKVFKNMEKITKAEGKGSQLSKIRLLAELLNSASGTEAKYIVRIPIGAMRLGIGEPTIMDALAINYLEEFRQQEKILEKKLGKKYKKKEDLERQLKFKLREKIEAKYNIHPDLGEIAEIIKEKGLKGIQSISIETGIPIRPTLAERLPSAKEIVEKIGTCAVEAKYDGFRFQVHKNGDKVIIFSRKMENMTNMFPEIVEGVKKQVKADKAIIEGEALAFEEETGEYYPFQVTIQRKRKYDIEEKAKELPLKLFVFDLMMFNGKDMMKETFRKRREKLEEIIEEGEIVAPTNTITTNKPEEIEKFFEESIEKGLEGIIAKDLEAKYIAGARKYAWIKLKRSYKGEMQDSTDLVIIGYYKGKGKRARFGLGGLLTACYNKKEDMFDSVARIGTGLSEQQLEEMEKRLSKISVKKKPIRVNSEITPDVWTEPKYVIEVVADEITESPMHVCEKKGKEKGLALRFPRLISFRQDKKPEQATTGKEIKQMFKKQKHVQKD